MQTSYKVSNLFSFERRCTGGRISSDSETMEVEGLQRNRNRYVNAFLSSCYESVGKILDTMYILFYRLPPYLKNPMDFKFFDEVIRSEDEAAAMVSNKRLQHVS